VIYRFGEFELDDQHYELRQSGEVKALPRKGFDLLCYLLSHGGRVVGKDEIFDRIWPALAVSENVLPVTVRTIRRVLGDEQGLILRTIRGSGYSIVCPVTEHASSAREAPAVASSVERSFVGREALMSRLAAEYAAAGAGDGRAVLVHGEAGMGKSRILGEFDRWVRRFTPFVVSAACRVEPGASARWPLLRVLEQAEELIASSSGAETRRILDDVERSYDELGDARTAELNLDLAAADVRFRFSRTLIRLLQQLSIQHPVVLLLDDLHEADADSLQVIHALVHEISGDRVLVLATYSQSQVMRGRESGYRVAKLAQASNAKLVQLCGFNEDEVAEFIRQEAEIEPRAELVAALYEKTEGNPFFLRETVRWLQREGRIEDEHDPAGGGPPATVRHVVLRRLEGLSEDFRSLLEWAAVIGDSFTSTLLEQVSDVESDQILHHLAAAENARIISSRSASGSMRPPGEYGFGHALIPEALYQELPAEERARRHRAVGLALEFSGGSSIGERVEELAHHFFQAAPAGELDRASGYAVRAAERALQRFAYEDAVAQLENLIAIEELRVPRDAHRQCVALLRLGEAQGKGGHYDAAEATLLRAAALARELEDPELYARTAIGRASDPFRRSGPELTSDGSPLSVRAHLEQAVEWGVHMSAEVRARALAALARRSASETSQASEHAERAFDLARESGSDTAVFEASMARLVSSAGPDHVERRLELADEIVRLARQMDVKALMAEAYTARIPLLFTVGDMPAADRDIAALDALARRLRTPRHTYDAMRFQMCRASGSGRFVESRRLADQVFKLGRQLGDPIVGFVTSASGLVLLSFVEGNKEVIRSALNSVALQTQMDAPSADAFGAHFTISTGDKQGARQLLERAASAGFENYPRTEDWIWNLSIMADACVNLRDLARSKQLYELLLPYAHRNVVNRMWNYRGSLSSVLGRLALVLGDRRAARDHLEKAIEFNRRIGSPVAVLINRFFYAMVLSGGASTERLEARETRKQVLAEAGRYGVLPFIQWIQREAGLKG